MTAGDWYRTVGRQNSATKFDCAKAQTAALREMLHIAWMNAAGEIYRTFLGTFYTAMAGTYESFFYGVNPRK